MPEFGTLYELYCQRCKRNGAMDFDDLLLQTNILLRDCPDVLARYQELFHYILVDEYQDTNYAQYVIIRRLSQTRSKVCVVGDDAQSIYSFRGAKIENILSFRKDYPDAMTFKLEQNYRSTRTIVEAANSVIERNSNAWRSAASRRVPPRARRSACSRPTPTATRPSRWWPTCATACVPPAAGGATWRSSTARTTSRSSSRTTCAAAAFPTASTRAIRSTTTKEIRDLLAYIRLVINPRDDEAFKRIVNYPARGIGDTTVQRIEQLAQQGGVSMWEAVDGLVAEPAADPVQKAIARKAAEFVAMIRSLSLARNEKGIYDFGLEIAARSGILGLYRRENTPRRPRRWATSRSCSTRCSSSRSSATPRSAAASEPRTNRPPSRSGCRTPCSRPTWTREDPEDRDKVTLMTVHSAKGLEYEFVYIVGMEENLFPSARAAESPDGFEEERRLFYVALTRAKTAATLSYAEMRFKWGNMEFSRPSCFLREIDPRYLEAAVEDAESADDRAEERRGPAIDALRRRFDYRYGRPQGAAGGEGASSPAGGRYAARAPGAVVRADTDPRAAAEVRERGRRAVRTASGRPRRAERVPIRPSWPRRAPRPRACAVWACGAQGRCRLPPLPDPAAGAYAVGDRVGARSLRRGHRAGRRSSGGRPQADGGIRQPRREDLLARFAKTDQTMTTKQRYEGIIGWFSGAHARSRERVAP